MKHKRLRQGLALAGALAAIVAGGLGHAAAQNVTQGYASDQALQNGMIVRLKPGDATKVEAVKEANASDMLGVTVASSAAPVSLSTPNQQQAYVATFGKYEVLVDDQNGAIKAGDFVTISAVDGIGAKATNSDQYVLGKALQNFAGTSDADSHAVLSDSKGSHRQVGIGRIVIDISVAHNPSYTGNQIAGVPSLLVNAARSVSDRPVTAIRIYACIVVLLFAFLLGGGILYSGIRSGMNAVGRNPFAKKSIMRSVTTVIIAALIVVITGLIGVYLILKL